MSAGKNPTDYEINVLRDLVFEIKEQADECLTAYQKDPSEKVAFGQVLAFTEVLTILRDSMVVDTELQKKLGLDFDPDARYLGVRQQAAGQ